MSSIPALLTRRDVQRITGYSRAHLYAEMRRGRFPLPLRLSPKNVRWVGEEVIKWIESRPRASGDVGK